MIQASAIIFGFILIFVLVAGLIVLWCRGADDLDAWGLFVSRVLRGDRQSIRKPPRDRWNSLGVTRSRPSRSESSKPARATVLAHRQAYFGV
jgi:hypothetical protein